MYLDNGYLGHSLLYSLKALKIVLYIFYMALYIFKIVLRAKLVLNNFNIRWHIIFLRL